MCIEIDRCDSINQGLQRETSLACEAPLQNKDRRKSPLACKITRSSKNTHKSMYKHTSNSLGHSTTLLALQLLSPSGARQGELAFQLLLLAWKKISRSVALIKQNPEELRFQIQASNLKGMAQNENVLALLIKRCFGSSNITLITS